MTTIQSFHRFGKIGNKITKIASNARKLVKRFTLKDKMATDLIRSCLIAYSDCSQDYDRR